MVQDAWAEVFDLHVNLAMNVGKVQGVFKKGDIIVLMGGAVALASPKPYL